MPPAMREKVAGCDYPTRSRRQKGDDDLAPRRIGNAGYPRKCYGRMLLENLLNFDRRDVDPRALDHFGAASGILQRSVPAQRAEITGPEVAIGRKCGGIELRTRAEIAFAEIALDLYLSDFTPLAFTARGVADSDLHTRQGRTLALGTLFQWPVVRCDAAVSVVLGGAVNVADLRDAEPSSCLKDFWRHSDRNPRSQRGGRGGLEGGGADKSFGQAGQRIVCRAFSALDKVECPPRLEMSLQHEGRAMGE